jgi:hypothetical protein
MFLLTTVNGSSFKIMHSVFLIYPQITISKKARKKWKKGQLNIDMWTAENYVGKKYEKNRK